MMPAKLLILDDDPLTCNTIAAIARMAGLTVKYTSDPQKFFEITQAWQPDFLAIDLIMPQMDGVQVMVELANQQCRAKIFITSGVGSRVLEAAGRAAGEHGLNICGVLPKPFTPTELRSLLESPSAEPSGATHRQRPAPAGPQVKAEDLAKAMANGEITLVYQPKIECNTGRLAGFEVLARWLHADLGNIPPSDFIPLAEQHGLIDKLTANIVDKSLQWLSEFKIGATGPVLQQQLDLLLKSVSLSINISARSLSNLTLFEYITERCQFWSIAPDRLILELTETSAMDDPVSSLDMLTRLRMKGFQLSIDDFGTGYSSMLQLVRLPFSEIKVDKSFVITARDSQESRTVIKSIVELGHSLGLQTTAEGIEDAETLDYIRETGCRLAQGYFIAVPMAEKALSAWILNREQTRERQRLDSLHALNLLDTPIEERFDRLTRLAKRLFNVPIVLISLVDEKRQWFKSVQGLDVTETPRELSFCTRTIGDDTIYQVPDASIDPGFADNPFVTGSPGIRFYAGAVLHSPDGSRIGTLCLIDTHPRTLDSSELRLLQDLALMTEHEFINDKAISTDLLTGLMNIQAFEARAAQALELAYHQKLDASMLRFRLDQLSHINRSDGALLKEQMLLEFSDILRRSWRSSDLIARVGDHDFAVLLLDTKDLVTKCMLQRLQSAVAISNSSGTLPIAYSIGVSRALPGEKTDFTQLLENAADHMYEAEIKGQLV